eukprot:CAMPEP_0205852478 /NCGR_PEP_ID=MMETSP1083-20121108/1043_1 /ASSEMBLY_ACC=CAM_ASM_000430 /TAXON_ID=97485 /ORGANISM="Prymnesium parvum, Strain Texoma1" /LENGTH=63 /DNA_ID=CAMNT_0053213689 /DNA_START=245 /DNA_END=436 /DNA_ORIENTATION=+
MALFYHSGELEVSRQWSAHLKKDVQQVRNGCHLVQPQSQGAVVVLSPVRKDINDAYCITLCVV